MKFLLIILSLFLFVSTNAQHGKIDGILTDTVKKKPIELCAITIFDSLNNAQTVLTNHSGKFIIDSLKPGRYSLKISGIFYRDSTIQDIEIDSGYTTHILINFPPYCQFSKETKDCPVCHKHDKSIPIIYGLPVGDIIEKSENGEVKLGGCEITGCDPKWFCTRDNKSY